MARKRVTLDTPLAVGDTVYTSRTSRIARTVTDLDYDNTYVETHGPIVTATRPGGVWYGVPFALSELWIDS